MRSGQINQALGVISIEDAHTKAMDALKAAIIKLMASEQANNVAKADLVTASRKLHGDLSGQKSADAIIIANTTTQLLTSMASGDGTIAQSARIREFEKLSD